jgi:hypothetical protein
MSSEKMRFLPIGLLWLSVQPAGIGCSEKEGWTMVRGLVIILLVVMVGSSAQGQEPLQPLLSWNWQQGQTLLYRIEQSTRVTDVVKDNTVETSSNLVVTRQWNVTRVEKDGVATVELKLRTLRLETKAPSGEVYRYDSEDKEHSTPELRDKLGKLVGTKQAVLRIDSVGRVVEVVETSVGSPSQYENELPFVGVLPDKPIQVGKAWDRPYKITLAPPQGTGETYAAIQHHRVREIKGDNVVIGVVTELKNQPEAVADRIPLLQLMPTGEFEFDRKAGLLRRAELHVDQTLPNHNGPGSSHRFQSVLKIALQER